MNREDKFFKNAKKVHGDTYDYSKVVYVDARTNVDIICRKHGVFPQKPDNHTSGSGCSKCGRERSEKAKLLKEEDFLLKSKILHNNFYGYNNIIFVDAGTKVNIDCPIHGSFPQTPTQHLQGRGCKECGYAKTAEKHRKSTEDFITKAVTVHGDRYDYSISEYKKATEDIKIICKIHGEFSQSAINHTTGSGCYDCGQESSNNSKFSNTEDYIKKAIKVHKGIYTYENVSYNRADETVIINCKKHGEFKQLAYNHLNGKGCPKCVGIVSKAETEIKDFISEYIEVEQSNRKVLDGKEIDIFIERLNVGIEYNGLYWHSDKHKERDHLLDKTKTAENKGIKIVHVFEDEWLYKKEIVKSRLLNLIGKTPNKIFARKCKIKEVSSKEVSKFLDENHIQGKLGATVRLGLYYNEELVSLMTFGELRKNLGQTKKEGSFELLRFCNKLNTNVIGGASRLLKYFTENTEYNEIISYADRRWSTGELYETLGFNKQKETKPNYFYTKGAIRESRFKFRKDVLVSKGYDKNKTEKEIMEELGYSRVYDCGSFKYNKTKNQK